MWKIALSVLVAICLCGADETRLRRRVRYYSSPPPGARIHRPTLPFPPPDFDIDGSPPPPPPPRQLGNSIRAVTKEDIEMLLKYAKDNFPEESRRPLKLEEYVNREMQDAMSAGEVLPPPANLRASPDLQPAHSRPAPAFAARPETVRDLPLADRRAPAPALSSYGVPHYSVTAHSTPSGGDGGGGESKLKAVAIWTHRSRGAAYTLHDDGTLSVERA